MQTVLSVTTLVLRLVLSHQEPGECPQCLSHQDVPLLKPLLWVALGALHTQRRGWLIRSEEGEVTVELICMLGGTGFPLKCCGGSTAAVGGRKLISGSEPNDLGADAQPSGASFLSFV